MKVLSIGTDRNLFKSEAAVRARILEYGQLFEELRIIVFALKELDLKPERLAKNVWIYPTNSRNRLFYLYDGWKLGCSLRGRFDVITAQDPFETGLVSWLIKIFTKAKLQLQIHTDFLCPEFKWNLLNRLRVWLAKFLLPKADGVRVVSQRIADSLKAKNWKLKAIPKVLPIWVDVEALRRAPITIDLHQKYPQFKKIILMISRLEAEKQIDLAIESLAELLLNKKDIGLVIVGSGSEEQKLKKIVKDLDLSESVKFEGWRENLATYYKTADLFLTTSRYEGYGVTIVEAVACGLPVVATDVGVAFEMNAIIIDDFANLSAFIRKLLDSPVKVKFEKNWPTKKEYLDAYKKALGL